MTILDSVLEVFDAIGTWISGAVNDILPMFYTAESGLTFLGVLAVAGLAFSVIFLVFSFYSQINWRGQGAIFAKIRM